MSVQDPDVVTVIPVGPGRSPDIVADTVESVNHYLTGRGVIVLVDDSGDGIGATVKERFDNVDLLVQESRHGLNAGLYLTLSHGFLHTLRSYRPQVILRLDTDALVTGPGPDVDAAEYFREHPDAGILGYFHADCNGVTRDFGPAARMLHYDLRFRRLLQNPVRRIRGWRLLRSARRGARINGYESGEHCLGGACFYSYECLSRLAEANLLGRREIAWSALEEDHIFGMFTRWIGMRNVDFSTGDLPMAVIWKGLPDHPGALLQRGKKVVHSTKFFRDMEEADIRAIFRTARNAGSAA